MADEWRSSTWGEEISLEYGKALRGYDIEGGKYRVFGSNGPIGWTAQPLAPGPGVILGRKGAYRGIQYSREPFFVIDTAYYVAPKVNLDMRWIYYAIIHHRLGEIDDGSPIPSTTRAAVSVRPLDVPPIQEQKAISHILGTLDDKIELNRRMNETLEQIARAIFKSWFVDFDPVRAKSEGCQPPGLDPPTAALFPDSFTDSPLGPIPKGWRLGVLGDLVNFQSGYAFRSKDWLDAGVPVVKIGSVKPGFVDLKQVSYVSTEVAEEATQFRLNVGDLLIGMTGYVGEVGLVPPTTTLPLLNQRVGKFVTSKSGTERLGYIYCVTRDVEFRSQVEQRSHGTAQANVSASAILQIPTLIPADNVLACFDHYCKSILDRLLLNQSESNSLAAIRDALLPKLLSGEIRIRDTNRNTEEIE